MRPDSITLAIEEKYSSEEKAEIAQQLAGKIADRETTKLEKSASDAAFNERLKAADAEISALAKKYNKGCETAQIGCDIRYDDPEPGKKSYYRMDRNELVETHEMGWEEKQETIQFNLPNPEAAETPGADELSKIMGDTTICEHPTVSSIDMGSDGTAWKCDTCGEVLSTNPSALGSESNPFPIGEIPPDDFDQSGSDAEAAGA